MQRKILFQVGGAVLTVLTLCALLFLPGRASAQVTARTATTTSINANVFLTSSMLQPTFQSSINAQVPQAMSQVIASMVGSLPKEDQGWATQMANALLQPSASLVSVTPQDKGLLVTLKLSLYQGDPKATTTKLLVGFSVANPTTIQVTALPLNGKSGLVTGPLITFAMPLGTLNSIAPALNCGDADLNISMKLPVAMSAQTASPFSLASNGVIQPLSAMQPLTTVSTVAAAPGAYIEIPAASLAQVGSAMGTMTVSSSLTADKIRVDVQKPNLVITSDLHWHGILIGNAVSTVAPGAANGKLAMHVISTDLKILGGLMTFPMNSYNAQTEQTLNSQLNSALAGKVTVSQAAVGGNSHIPCALGNSLVLTGDIIMD
ncbi:MAG TPA: hypothetical protein VFN35_30070 [Ktedonobacteraceae bacterium]|nr:hypothetical protein [Ktedonobacteraceae bacterium]